MDRAKEAVSSFLSRSGQHKTEVEEQQIAAVTQETVKPHRHEISTQAIQKEQHQHHYHTTVQPISHEETLPENHTHNARPVEHVEYRHEDPNIGHENNQKHLANFIPSRTTHETQHTKAEAPTVTGEHFHHHVHEKVQPIVYKDVHQPEIVHTVKPIHEIHHAPSEHHGLSMLGSLSLDDIKAQGIDLIKGSGGIAHHKQDYEGHPRGYNPKYQLERHPIDIEPEKHLGLHDLEGTGHPYESKFEHAIAEPLKTAYGYMSGVSKMGGEKPETEVGKSVFGYDIEHSAGKDRIEATGGTEGGLPTPAAGTSTAAAPLAAERVPTASSSSSGTQGIRAVTTNPRDFAAGSPAQQGTTSGNLDPRAHWSASEGAEADDDEIETTTTTTTTTTTAVNVGRERPDSGISIPDRGTSRGKASLDEAIGRSP